MTKPNPFIPKDKVEWAIAIGSLVLGVVIVLLWLRIGELT